jgi:type II secretory pathway component GspD/PulD (secretin)
MKSLLENSTHAGVPYLRSVPVLSWMFAEDNSTRGDKKVLILVSPRLAGQTTTTTPVVQSTAPVLQESEKSTDERKIEKRKRRFFFF